MNLLKYISILFLIFNILAPEILSQKIKILRPATGENVGGNSSYSIYYYGPSLNSTFIDYSADNGTSWKLIKYGGGGSGNGGNTVYWKVPNLSTKQCLLRIIQKSDSTNFDITPGNFTIFPVYYDTTSVNEIIMWFSNDGISSSDPNTDGQGLFWPGGKYATKGAVFTDGFVFGCYQDDSLIVNGSAFRTGFIPGNIKDGQLQSDPADSIFKIWKIRKDWESLPPDSFRVRLEYDYKNWPMKIGAPYEDVDKDSKYSQGIDKPKFYGDETSWFVCNALDSNRGILYNKSYPIGIEVQCTVFGFDSDNFLKDVIIKKYKVINKTSKTLKDMIFSYFSDFDLGDGGDDYVGGDSTLDIGYGYNGREMDYIYGIPPAIGYQLLQGPITKGKITDSAFFNDSWIKGFNNLRMSSFAPNFKNFALLIGDPNNNIQWYNSLQGLRTWTNDTMVNPISGEKTVYWLMGDPVEGIGWYEGMGWPGGPDPGDRRLMINSGKFDMQPADTQEVVYAILLAQGTDRINSVSELKKKAKGLKEFYYRSNPLDVNSDNLLSMKYFLGQNYPNPFNPTTNIDFKIAKFGLVTLKVFDVLGREITTLINEMKLPGIYHYTFSLEKYSLSSGIYFYQLRSGNLVQTKKMILLK